MSIGQIVQTIIEIAMVGGLFWGIFNEYKLIDFEDKIKVKIKFKNFPKR